jgi:NADP-dependent 3-hydroxy acid dehydrogenase YdfG
MSLFPQMYKSLQDTIDKCGTIDILVNNAGVGVFKEAVDLQVDEFDQMWNLNMRGTFLMTRAVLGRMIQARSGSVVNICSLAGKTGLRGGSGYAASKRAMRGFANSLMFEVREHNIRVITIFPGSVDTSFSSNNNKHVPGIPTPQDIASTVAFAVTAPEHAMFSEIDVRPTNPPK